MSGDGGVVECIGKIQKETPQTAAAWLSQADDAGSGVGSPVDLEGEGQRDLTLNGWPVSQLDDWCGTFLDDGDVLDFDVDVGSRG